MLKRFFQNRHFHVAINDVKKGMLVNYNGKVHLFTSGIYIMRLKS
jgi:hypothetical protein